MPGAKPWATAAGRSSAVVTGRKPRSRTAARSPFPPTTSTAEPGSSRPASSVAAAWAEVTTSAAVAGTPKPAIWAAIAEGVREELLVTYASRIPASAALARAWGAPGTAASPR